VVAFGSRFMGSLGLLSVLDVTEALGNLLPGIRLPGGLLGSAGIWFETQPGAATGTGVVVESPSQICSPVDTDGGFCSFSRPFGGDGTSRSLFLGSCGRCRLGPLVVLFTVIRIEFSRKFLPGFGLP